MSLRRINQDLVVDCFKCLHEIQKGLCILLIIILCSFGMVRRLPDCSLRAHSFSSKDALSVVLSFPLHGYVPSGAHPQTHQRRHQPDGPSAAITLRDERN